MLDAADFLQLLGKSGFSFYTGVPDSLLKDLCACISEQCRPRNHVITVNEGGAVALASGYHLATGRAALVYMQNSGTGNAVNPLLSLADSEVYALPMMLVIGWRGEPGVKDEPQHTKQGRVQESLMQALEYPYEILSDDIKTAAEQVRRLSRSMYEQSTPVALLVRKGTFAPYKSKDAPAGKNEQKEMSREEALEIILQGLSPEDRIVSTTGKASREIFEIREALDQGHARDFLTVGSMGHAGMIALGLAEYQDVYPPHKVVLIDGDGAALMHLGGMALIGNRAPENLTHIIMNNGSHDSVGGQPTIGRNLSFAALSGDMGYVQTETVSSRQELKSALDRVHNAAGPALLDVRVRKGARPDLGRPTTSPQQNKTTLMEGLQHTQRVLHKKGSLAQLPQLLKENRATRLLVFHGGNSFSASGAKPVIDELEAQMEVVRIGNLPENPDIETVRRAVGSYHHLSPDALLAVGGGSVIDTAKAVLATAGGGTEADILSNRFFPPERRPWFIAVPTTAGSGSEATHFAVLYKDGKKHSLAHSLLRPDVVVLDPATIISCPDSVALSAGMDAVCQAIESYWNRNADEQSRKYSVKSLSLVLPSLLSAAEHPDNMLLAAHYAGKAINITKTTAGHALAYGLTTGYGVPHGLAVMLVMERLIPLMLEKYSWQSKALDPLFAEASLGKGLKDGFLSLSSEVKKRTKLAVKSRDIPSESEKLAKAVNLERLANHPVRLAAEDIQMIYMEILRSK